jgi:ERCC4-type nuclease
MIKIDVRERDLIDSCKSKLSTPKFQHINITTENLPIGDIIINNGQDVIIIERKTLKDLAASIKDGRYEEQSYRLNGSEIHNHNIIYLIEGDLTKYKDAHNIDKNALYSAMFSINHIKGFSLMRSLSVDESATIICNIMYKLLKCEKENKKSFYLNSDANAMDLNTDAVNYCHVVKKVKKENITVDNIGEIMLCQIPTVSSTIAISVLLKFKTIANLIESIKADEKCLCDLTYINVKNQQRKISKSAIENIIKFLV